jgi:PAS domain S-box-containing protein
MHARGRVVGVLSVMNYAPYQFADEEITVLRAIADQVGVALDNARLYEHTKEQSSRLSAVLHSSGDAIIATDSYGNINLINSTAEELFDIRPDDIMGTPLRHAPLHPKLCDGLRRAMSNDEAGNTVFEVTLDSGRSLSAIVSPVYARQLPESDEEAEGWVMVVQDVSHLREAEQTRVNFIHAAAHDLRNPLGATLGALAILEDDLQENELHQELIGIALQSIDRMQDLIDNLLSLEHIESGIGVVSKRVDMREVIERGMLDVRSYLLQNEQDLTLDVPDTLPAIMGDIQWLHRALLNLLGNACKYTQKGGVIKIRAYEQDNDLYLEVEDNGPGIPPESQTRLFERFYRVPQDNQEVKGSGLGLAIVKSVVEQHGGRVFVQSRVGQGSIFGITLPVAAEKPGGTPAE